LKLNEGTRIKHKAAFLVEPAFRQTASDKQPYEKVYLRFYQYPGFWPKLMLASLAGCGTGNNSPLPVT
jgi:hypothetical protein